jgi:type IV pilus assembly protein PilM
MAVSAGIGLDIGEDQIRVVELRRTSRGLQLQAMGAAPPPPGALSGGAVLDVRLLAEGLRRVLRENRISSFVPRVVVGLPGRVAASRVLELPEMPKADMRAVVAGEMEHYRMIPAGQGTFDFVTLGEPNPNSGQVRLLLMAADKKVVDTYREALRLAGLPMSALEPLSLAASRAAFSSVNRGGVALVAVGARTTELAIFSDGALCYSRQIDTGGLDLSGPNPSATLDLSQSAEPAKVPLEESVTLPALGGVAGGDLQSLVYELRRSLDFYHREAPAAGRVERVVLSADGSRLRGLDRYLETNLGLPVSMCQPFQGVAHSNSRVNSEYLRQVGPAFASAMGLALRALEEVPQAPRLDLSDTGAESRLAKVAPRWLTWALGISILLVVITSIASFLVGGVVQKRQQLLAASKAELARVTELERERTSAARRAEEAQHLVQLRGLPWSEILFQVSEFIPQGVWLTNLGTESGNVLSLEGVALSADSVATLMDSLTRSALFSGPRMTSIQKDTSGRHALVKYQMKVTVTQPPPEARAPAGAPPLPPSGPAAAGGQR